MSLLKELREQVRFCPDTKLKATISHAVEDLAEAIERFYKDRDMASMTRLNGAWARGLRVKWQTPGPFSPQGGAKALDEFQKAA